MKPWLTAGTTAVDRLSTGTQPGGQFDQFGKFQMKPLISDPSYNWRKQEGINALAASGAARGNYGSGNLGVALQNYGQNLASTEYQNEYTRQFNEYNNQYQQWQDQYNRLAGIAGTGQVTAQNLGQMGYNAANAMGEARMGGANALASGQIGSAQAQAGAITGWGKQIQGLVGMGANYLQQQNLYDQNRLTASGQNANAFYSGLQNQPWISPEGYDMGGYGSASGAAF
jgi:hypothetical protein